MQRGPRDVQAEGRGASDERRTQDFVDQEDAISVEVEFGVHGVLLGIESPGGGCGASGCGRKASQQSSAAGASELDPAHDTAKGGRDPGSDARGDLDDDRARARARQGHTRTDEETAENVGVIGAVPADGRSFPGLTVNDVEALEQGYDYTKRISILPLVAL